MADSSSPKKPAAANQKAVAAKQQQLKDKAADAQHDDDFDDEEEYEGGFVDWFADQASWLVSMVVHAVLLAGLSFFTFSNEESNDSPTVLNNDAEEVLPDEEDPEPPEFDTSEEEDKPQNEDRDLPPETTESENISQDQLEAGENSLADEPEEVNTDDITPDTPFHEKGVGTEKGNGSGGRGTGAGAGIGGRGKRRTGALGKGASIKSEKAVEAALKWLAEHQLQDGSWDFDHTGGACQGRCDHKGTYISSHKAATAMGILPFLGAGYTHEQGKYKRTVAAGLNYLIAHGKSTKNGDVISWYEAVGNHYSHGVVTLALCEAYAMTLNPPSKKKKNISEMTKRDKEEYLKEIRQEKAEKRAIRFNNGKLKKAAQGGLNYIMQTQYSDGGWRYRPPSAKKANEGDTSVVGWMVMALKSGYMARLQVSKESFLEANKFLDTVKHNSHGSEFKYMHDSPTKDKGKIKKRPIKATTAIGLLLRMYTTWPKSHPALANGVKRVSKWGPNRTDLYYDYYATQVVHHYGGKDWNRWNTFMRDHLVNKQSQKGHSTGSWFFESGHGGTNGGRLYNTSMATMILEVYYRHSPIYKEDSLDSSVTKKVEKDDKKDKKSDKKGKKDDSKKDKKKTAAKK